MMQPFEQLRTRLPLIRQDANGECALACIAMIGAFYGHEIDFHRLKADFPTTRQGLSLSAVTQVADRLGFDTRGLALAGLEEMALVRLPAIIHWDDNHFIVLKSVKRGRYTVHDPASGIWQYREADFARHFSGHVLELAPSANFVQIVRDKKYPLSTILRSTRGLYKSLAQVAVMGFTTNLLTLALPAIVQVALDSVIPKADLALLQLLAIGIFFASVLIGLAEWTHKRIVLNAGTAFAAQLTHNAVGHIFRLPLSYFERKHPGEIAVRLDSIDGIRSVVMTTTVNAAIDLMMLILCGVLMLMYMPSLALVVSAIFVIVLVIRAVSLPPVRRYGGLSIRARAEERSRLIDNVRASASIKMANAAHAAVGRWYESLVKRSNASFKVGLIEADASLAVEIATALGTAATLYLGVIAVIEQTATVGVLYAFYTYRGIFFDKIDKLVTYSQEIAMLGVNMNQLNDFLEQDPEVDGFIAERTIQRDIALRGASFRPGFADRPIVDAVDLTIPSASGAMIGISGPSGSGKTTLLKLLAGLYTPSSGELLVDGVELRNWGLFPYRENVALLLGSDRIARGSIGEIVSSYEATPDQGRIERALDAACLLRDVRYLPQGMRTVLTEESGVLSSGQRRRLMLARALYREPAILLLDEVTSNLDAATSEALLENLGRLPATKVIATHDPAALATCDVQYEVVWGRVRPGLAEVCS